jgi:hypothetical protein
MVHSGGSSHALFFRPALRLHVGDITKRRGSARYRFTAYFDWRESRESTQAIFL